MTKTKKPARKSKLDQRRPLGTTNPSWFDLYTTQLHSIACQLANFIQATGDGRRKPTKAQVATRSVLGVSNDEVLMLDRLLYNLSAALPGPYVETLVPSKWWPTVVGKAQKASMIKAGWAVRCEEDEPGCALCEAWRLFDQLGRPPTKAEMDARMDQVYATTPSLHFDDQTKPVIDEGREQTAGKRATEMAHALWAEAKPLIKCRETYDRGMVLLKQAVSLFPNWAEHEAALEVWMAGNKEPIPTAGAVMRYAPLGTGDAISAFMKAASAKQRTERDRLKAMTFADWCLATSPFAATGSPAAKTRSKGTHSDEVLRAMYDDRLIAFDEEKT